jgi:predicted Zn-dependent protease
MLISVNITWLSALLLPLWLVLQPVNAPAQDQYMDLPSIGDSSGTVISPGQEQQLGAAFMRQLRSSGVIFEDLEITSYLESLGQRLTVNSENPEQRFTFFVVDESSINAFAGPGGYIGVHTGLFLASESESELAAVLAHEIAHVTQRHLARAYEASERLSLPSMAAMLAAILVASQHSEAGQAAMAAVTAGGLQYQINFTRANEKEADRVGIQTLAHAGFDTYGMPRFFERLQKNSRLYGSRPPEFLSTHPVTTDRIAEATSRAERYAASKQPDSLDFQLVRAKLRVNNYDNPNQVLDDFRRYLDKGQDSEPDKLYEYALLLTRTGKTTDAQVVLARLHGDDPDRVAYRLALADTYNSAGKHRQALDIYRDSLQLYPGDILFVAPYARTLLDTGQATAAADILKKFSDKEYNNSQIYKLLAQVAGATGRDVQTHTAMSHYYHLNGYTREALEQLKLAARVPEISGYESARIQARTKELEALLEVENKMK